MFTPGDLYYFHKLFFPGGATPKSKFFLVLHTDGKNAILVSLPSSQDRLPDSYGEKAGCFEDPSSGIGCFVIHPKEPVCHNGYCFEKKTFLYAEGLDEYKVSDIKTKYLATFDYELKGTLLKPLLTSIIECFSSSDQTKNKFRRLLGDLPK